MVSSTSLAASRDCEPFAPYFIIEGEAGPDRQRQLSVELVELMIQLAIFKEFNKENTRGDVRFCETFPGRTDGVQECHSLQGFLELCYPRPIWHLDKRIHIAIVPISIVSLEDGPWRFPLRCPSIG